MTASCTDDVLALYERWGSNNYDEELSQRDHALQTAALAAQAHAPAPLVIAALLHDVGHLLVLDSDAAEDGTSLDLTHEALGARYLAGLFPPSVTGPIALHVRAKRYRCAVDPAYRSALSAGSKRSLELQGGPMSEAEVIVFSNHPGFEDAVRLRGWDDKGKVDGLDVAPFEHYRDVLEQVATH
jgi:phosphonate degradation associated HDIG domain protein